MGESKIASAEDFRRNLQSWLGERIGAADAATVPLPSGLTVRLRVIGAEESQSYLRLHARQWRAMKDETESNESKPSADREYSASVAYGDFLTGMLSRLFVEPAFGNLPEQIALGDIRPSDFRFLLRWVGGEVTVRPDGSIGDLDTFPGRPGGAGGIGVDSAAEPVPPERVAGIEGDGSVAD